MIRKEDYMKIQVLHERGMYQKDIAEELGIHPKTVSRALKRGSVPQRATKQAVSKLEPYKAQIDQWLTTGVWNGMVIWRKLQEAGYSGGYTMVRQYIAPKRALRQPPGADRLTVRFETKPAEQLQSDWGEVMVKIDGQATKVYFIVNTLGYSRRFHFWCCGCTDAEHTYEGLIRSFEYFGGVTTEVLVDNQKSAVLTAAKTGNPIFQARFLDLATHYGFQARACRPYRAPRHPAPKAKTNGWWATSNTIFLSGIRPLRVGCISTNWRNNGCGTKQISGARAQSKKLYRNALPKSNPRSSRCHRNAMIPPTWSGAPWLGIAMWRYAATATAFRRPWLGNG